MKRKQVAVSDLLLCEQNPRVDVAESQLDEIDKIYNFSNINSQSTSKRQLMNLAESIATNGYQNEVEPILTTEKDGKYIVRDANRRISCIKMLLSPERYKDILDDKDLKTLQKLKDNFDSNIPRILEVVVFQENEEEKLREILARKHDGPQDGVGTLPWPSEAKSRFFDKKDFTGKLEEQFAEQYGQSLTSYIGGSNAVTSTRRVFNSSPVKRYLAIKDSDNLTEDELDKVKDLADETKAYIQETGMQLSRLKSAEIQDAIIDPLVSRNQPKPTVEEIAEKTAKQFVNQHTTRLNKHLGGRYDKYVNIDFNNPHAVDLNFLLSALIKYGDLPGDYGARQLKAYLLAPAIRVFYELALLMISRAGLSDITLPSPNVSVNLEENINYIHDKFRNDDDFANYLSSSCTLFDTYHEARDIIDETNFAQSATMSHLSSHKSAKDYDMDTLIRLFNDGVLFALLSEQYVRFRNRQNDSSV